MERSRRYLAAIVLTIFFVVPAVLRADCPEGSRTTTEAERQEYMRTLNVLRAVPPAPSGWQLQTPKFGHTEAPIYTCKGLKLPMDPHEVTYVSIEQQQVNEQNRRERDARIAALRKLSLEEQKQVDDFNRQGMQLSGQSAAARKNNPTDAARLREQAMQAYAKSKAIQQSHADKIATEIGALRDDRSNYGNPEVRVQLAMDDLPSTANSGTEKVKIPSVPRAFFDDQKSLIMWFGRDASGRNIRVRLEGDRERILTVARLFAESSLRTLAAK